MTLVLPRFKMFPLALNLASAVRSLRQIDHKADDDRLLQLSISMFLKFDSVEPTDEKYSSYILSLGPVNLMVSWQPQKSSETIRN